MNTKKQTEYKNNLVVKVANVLSGQEVDNVIPVLAVLLGNVGATMGADRKAVITFVVDAINEEYDKFNYDPSNVH